MASVVALQTESILAVVDPGDPVLPKKPDYSPEDSEWTIKGLPMSQYLDGGDQLKET